MVIIADRGLADKIISAVSPYANFPSIIRSRGTASNEVLAALGIGEPEKDMIFCFCEWENVDKIYGLVSGEFQLDKTHKGIALTIPLTAVAGNLTLQIITGKTKDLM